MASDSVVPPGVWVDDSDEDDPVLRQADGTIVDTWRKEYPYPPRLERAEYDHHKRLLQSGTAQERSIRSGSGS